MGRDDELLLHLKEAVRAVPVERPHWDPAVLETAPPLRLHRRSKALVGAAVAGGLLVASTGLAAAGALPDPAQHVAHEVLGSVGVDVPDPERYHGPECGETVGRNHGAYVSEDPALAKSDCGKPLRGAAAASGNATKGDRSAKADDGDPCSGPPPWAGRDDLTEDEVAAAKAARETECGADEDAPASPEAGSTTTEAPWGAQDTAPPSTVPTTTTTVVASSSSVPDTVEGTSGVQNAPAESGLQQGSEGSDTVDAGRPATGR